MKRVRPAAKARANPGAKANPLIDVNLHETWLERLGNRFSRRPKVGRAGMPFPSPERFP